MLALVASQRILFANGVMKAMYQLFLRGIETFRTSAFCRDRQVEKQEKDQRNHQSHVHRKIFPGSFLNTIRHALICARVPRMEDCDHGNQRHERAEDERSGYCGLHRVVMGVAGKRFSEQHPAKQPDEIPADGF